MYSHRVDEYGALKPNGWFWLCIFVQVEAVLLTAIHLFLAQSEMNLLARVVGLKDWLMFYLLVSIPAMLLVIAYWLRRPGAKKIYKTFWLWGRWLLAIGFVGHLLLDSLRWVDYGLRLDSLSVFFLIIKAWLLLVLLLNPYLKALFASLPMDD